MAVSLVEVATPQEGDRDMNEWMPVNPCEDCRIELSEALGTGKNIYGFNNECQCSDLSAHYKMVYAQRKLLRYLIADAKNINNHNLYPIIGKVQLELMLKQLEASQ